MRAVRPMLLAIKRVVAGDAGRCLALGGVGLPGMVVGRPVVSRDARRGIACGRAGPFNRAVRLAVRVVAGLIGAIATGLVALVARM